MSIIVETPFQNFTGLDGKPLTNGKVYIGQVGTDPTVFANQIPVFWDEAMTIPAAQPLTTSAGYIVRTGTPARVWVATDYSISVKNSSNLLVYYVAQFGAKNFVDADDLAAGNGSSLVGITPAGSASGATSTTVENYVTKTLPRSIFDFMSEAQIDAVLSGTGALDVGDTVAAAINSAPLNSALYFPSGVYNLGDSNLSISNLNCCHLIGAESMPEFRWVGLASNVDAISIIGNSYRRATIENIIVNPGYSGQDAIKIYSGKAIRLRRVTVSNARRDSLSIYCNNFNWVERLLTHDVSLQGSGRNAITMEVSGPNGAFINESVFSSVEVRGVSLKETGGCAVVAVVSGAGNAKMSEIQWNACNFDAQRASSIANGFDIGPNPMRLGYTPTGANLFESWTINGGSWETTTGPADFRANGLVFAERGTLPVGWKMVFGVSARWSSGGVGGQFLDYVMSRENGPFRVQYPNSWKQQDAASSSFILIDVPFPVVPVAVGARQEQAAAYELSIFGARFPGTDIKVYKQDIYLKAYPVGTDTYWFFTPTPTIQLSGADLFTLTSVTVVNSSLGTTLTADTPPWGLRCAISTSATWGTGGGENTFHAIMMYKGGCHGQYSY